MCLNKYAFSHDCILIIVYWIVINLDFFCVCVFPPILVWWPCDLCMLNVEINLCSVLSYNIIKTYGMSWHVEHIAFCLALIFKTMIRTFHSDSVELPLDCRHHHTVHLHGVVYQRSLTPSHNDCSHVSL